MRRGRSVTAAVFATAIVCATAGSAHAYVDTGADEEDAGAFLDVESTTREVYRSVGGRRALRVTLSTWEPIGRYTFYEVTVRLDTRGDRRPDALMRIFRGDGGSGDGEGCTVAGRPARLIHDQGVVGCTVRLAWIAPRKEIRWWLLTDSLYSYEPPAVRDRAPDVGWYP